MDLSKLAGKARRGSVAARKAVGGHKIKATPEKKKAPKKVITLPYNVQDPVWLGDRTCARRLAQLSQMP